MIKFSEPLAPRPRPAHHRREWRRKRSGARAAAAAGRSVGKGVGSLELPHAHLRTEAHQHRRLSRGWGRWCAPLALFVARHGQASSLLYLYFDWRIAAPRCRTRLESRGKFSQSSQSFDSGRAGRGAHGERRHCARRLTLCRSVRMRQCAGSAALASEARQPAAAAQGSADRAPGVIMPSSPRYCALPRGQQAMRMRTCVHGSPIAQRHERLDFGLPDSATQLPACHCHCRHANGTGSLTVQF